MQLFPPPAPPSRFSGISWLLALIVLPLAVGCQDRAARSWPEVMAQIRARFPDVEQISTQELARLLQESGNGKPLLVDVRTPQEYAVSHLKGAVRAQTVEEVESLVHGQKETPLILYCSVGYRSSQLAAALMKAGFRSIRNLEGSIFKWANEGRPVYRDGKPVHAVHPYDEDWGRLLDPSLRQ
ncbi:MAG: rhodanese-like domain-containing protein [Acidobacteriota bacterium]|jgi:rhodanese-related sulfurtransferase